MTTAAAIANTALIPLERKRITSLGEGSPSANDVNEIYSETRLRLLRRHDWNFARKRIELGREAATPASGFDYQYQLPSDWIRTIVVSDSDTGRRGVRYRIEQDSILCDAENVFLTYIYNVTDEAAMPPDFRDYFAYTLGISLAKTSTQRKEMREMQQEAKAAAMSIDSVEDDTDDVPDGDWYTDRFL